MSISHRRKAYLLMLSTWQRRLIYFVAASFVALLLANMLPTQHNAIPNLMALVFFLCSIVCMFKLVRLRYGKWKAALATLVYCVPVVNLVVLGLAIALLNRHTTSLGARAGFFGVDPASIKKM